MKMEKRTSSNLEYPFAKKGEDIKDGDLVTFLNAGDIVESQFGKQKVFGVKTPQGEYSVNLNQTSENHLVEFLGDDSEEWVGKEAKAWVNRENVSGEMRKVLYFTHPDGDLDNPVPKASGGQTPEKPVNAPPKQPPYPEEDINPDDIPW